PGGPGGGGEDRRLHPDGRLSAGGPATERPGHRRDRDLRLLQHLAGAAVRAVANHVTGYADPAGRDPGLYRRARDELGAADGRLDADLHPGVRAVFISAAPVRRRAGGRRGEGVAVAGAILCMLYDIALRAPASSGASRSPIFGWDDTLATSPGMHSTRCRPRSRPVCSRWGRHGERYLPSLDLARRRMAANAGPCRVTESVGGRWTR